MREHIERAFRGDEDIYLFFDPNIKPKSLKEVVDSIVDKIEEFMFAKECDFVAVEHGYFFYLRNPNILVSFCVNKEHRTLIELTQFWIKIKETIANPFICFLWSINTRAIKWLQKMGMEIDKIYLYEGNSVTILKLT